MVLLRYNRCTIKSHTFKISTLLSFSICICIANILITPKSFLLAIHLFFTPHSHPWASTDLPSVTYRFLVSKISHLFFPLRLVGTWASPSAVKALRIVLSASFQCFFLWPQEFPSHACFSQYLAEDWRGILFRSLEFSSYTALSSQGIFLLSGTLPHPHFPNSLLTLSPQLSGVACLFWPPPSFVVARKLSSGSKLGPSEGRQRLDFIHFASLRDDAFCCLWSSVWKPFFPMFCLVFQLFHKWE